MFLRRLISVIIAFIILSLPEAQVFAADSGNGTVQDMLKQQNTQQNRGSSTATGSSSAAPATLYGGSNLFLDFIKIIFSLALVLALIYLLYRFAAKRTGRYKEGSNLKNLGGVSVGSNRSIQLIRLGDKVMVIGVGDNVQLLKEISEPEEIEALNKQTDAVDPIENGVYKILKWTSDRNSAKSSGQPDSTWNTLRKRLMINLDSMKSERSEKINELVREGQKK